jgi:hypothetical protein
MPAIPQYLVCHVGPTATAPSHAQVFAQLVKVVHAAGGGVANMLIGD